MAVGGSTGVGGSMGVVWSMGVGGCGRGWQHGNIRGSRRGLNAMFRGYNGRVELGVAMRFDFNNCSSNLKRWTLYLTHDQNNNLFGK